MSTTTTNTDVYEFHGYDLISATNKEVRTDCSFCWHEGQKFYINRESGLYNCKHCGASGNPQTFLQRLWELHYEATDESHYKALSSDRRGVPWKTFMELGFAWDSHLERWLIPICNPQGNVINLRVWKPRTSKSVKSNPVIGTKSLPSSLFNLQQLSDSGPIFICEGEWDAVCLVNLLQETSTDGSVVAVPGANIFKEDWKRFFQTRHVILLYDNDGPGSAGMERVAFILQGVATTVKAIRWPSTFPPSYDIRDYCTDHVFAEAPKTKQVSEQQALDSLLHLVHPITTTSQSIATVDDEPEFPKIQSFKELLGVFSKYISLDRRMTNGLALMAATVVSTSLPGDPVWLFAVGPPGSGKTLLLRAFERSIHCIFKSRITVASLVSGMKISDEEDPSLFPKLRNKSLIIKDFTEVLDMNSVGQDDLFAALRGAFDGIVDVQFGNGKHCYYDNLHFSIIAGVTYEIYRVNKSSLGERFLRYKVVDTEAPDYDSTNHIMSALRAIPHQVEGEQQCQLATAGFVNYIYSKTNSFPPLPKSMENRIVALAQVTALLRTKVERSYDRTELIFRPSTEVGTRLARQFIKLMQSLALVYGKKTIDNEIYSLVYEVAMDTVFGWPYEIVNYIITRESTVAPTTIEIANALNTTSTTVTRCCDNLRILNIIDKSPKKQKTSGHPHNEYSIQPAFAKLWKKAQP